MNLIEGLQAELTRCRELLEAYKELGTVGLFGKLVIQESVHKGEAAMVSGDVIKMLRAYEDLKQRQ